MTRTLIITHDIESVLLDKVKDALPDWNIISGRNKEVWHDKLNQAEIIVGWKKEMALACLEQPAELRWLQSWTAGVNNLPLSKLKERDILVTGGNGVHAYPISETVFALMLALTRNIHTYVRNQQKKVWHDGSIRLELHQKTIGIIGVGAIGKETAKIAKAFGMTVLGVRRSAKPTDYVDEMYPIDELNSILPKCDYVVVTLPLTKETHHLFGQEQFAKMKRSAFFINIGRGDIVDEESLITALQQEQLAGAGLDVVSTEPLPADSPLWEMEQVIITPHTAGATEHYARRLIEDIFLPNLKSYLAGNQPSLNVIDYEAGY
ncbi:D-2-hydroxyacid dehydrogenase [Alkalihalobacillus oceani]|uniref:D-2-hydroxyacid dehydrogenase n=1 Tax=Halalkalibacter oceani TaxID=1653776 RepID=UPI0020423C7E|nr:D-2-hydroxyacid dehydrogenase [Halalkalibacter oceani]MCM3759970.1 D-2-hydroxyacid dehydrogenase [Halalkalibacter oceani]